MRDVRHHRREAGAGADADQQPCAAEKTARFGAKPGDDETEAQSDSAGDDQRNGDAGAVGHAPQHDRAEGETEHHQRVGQRGGRAVDAEFELRSGKTTMTAHMPAPDEGRDQQRQSQARERVGAVGPIAVGGFEGFAREKDLLRERICGKRATMASAGAAGG